MVILLVSATKTSFIPKLYQKNHLINRKLFDLRVGSRIIGERAKYIPVIRYRMLDTWIAKDRNDLQAEVQPTIVNSILSH